MSGISRGSIFFTPVVMALSVMNTAENIAKTAGKIAFAGAIAVHRYNKKQEEKKVTKLSDDIEKLDKSVAETLNVQREELYRTIENVLDEMSEVQNIISENIDSSDGEAFRNLLRETGNNTVSSIEKIHSRFKKCYDEAVNRSNSEISSALTSLKEKVAAEIKNAESDIAAREKRAAERAQSLINDARKLSSAFNSEAGEKYITEAEYDVMKGNYQSAVSLASSAITQIYMDMYRSDAEEKERDFYRSSLVYFSAEIKELLDSLHSVEFRMSEESDEILSADLTQFMKCEYEEFCRKSEESERFISEDAENADSIELHKRSDELGKLLAEIKEEMADAFSVFLKPVSDPRSTFFSGISSIKIIHLYIFLSELIFNIFIIFCPKEIVNRYFGKNIFQHFSDRMFIINAYFKRVIFRKMHIFKIYFFEKCIFLIRTKKQQTYILICVSAVLLYFYPNNSSSLFSSVPSFA